MGIRKAQTHHIPVRSATTYDNLWRSLHSISTASMVIIMLSLSLEVAVRQEIEQICRVLQEHAAKLGNIF